MLDDLRAKVERKRGLWGIYYTPTRTGHISEQITATAKRRRWSPLTIVTPVLPERMVRSIQR
jgi:hypothetical protein